MENFKPRLFFFGDSFVQWPEPNPGHWTERFSDDYTVYRLGSNGASNEHIAFQLGVLPDYREGDRIVIVLTEPFRLPKWMFGNHYSDYCDFRTQDHFNGLEDASYFVKSMVEINLIKDRLIQDKETLYHENFLDNPQQVFNLFGMFTEKLSQYRPVLVTWSSQLKETVLSEILTYIPQDTYTTNTQEGSTNPHDYHPGLEGGKVWYNIVKGLLDNWIKTKFVPKKIGTNFFENGCIIE